MITNQYTLADEPSYFLPHSSSNTSNDLSQSRPKNRKLNHVQDQKLIPGIVPSPTNGSSADDFRSVIDDLTIENKKLRERLRRYEKSQSSHLDKDKLFEVKIHALPARKRRELEDTLRAFASSLDDSTDGGSSKEVSLNPAMRVAPKHQTSSLSSISRPVDSAYASMSISGPTSTTTLNQTSLDGTASHQSRAGKEQKTHSFLHNIPESLIPNHSPVMTERQKKKLVVQRLEELFVGKRGVIGGEHSQPLQQQEVSRSAARADQAGDHRPSTVGGLREAHMLPSMMEVDGPRPGKLSGEGSNDTQASRYLSDASEDSSPDRSFPEQRPTRPSDLDPHRAQIPSENVEYIRHLGMSTPQLITEDSADAAADAQGWIYLNLLINMAQLHIINVTPDFIRSAVADVSEKFQLSRDGKKIRWRGGSRGTLLSGSDSGTSSSLNRSPHDSDSLDESTRKRRKVDVGRFASVPIDVHDSRTPAGIPGPDNSFHYKPLFNHRGSSSGGLISSDDSESNFGYGQESTNGEMSHAPQTWSGRSRSGSQKRRRDDGPIVFYSGAKFCTDMSGDRGNISTPLYITGVGGDGYSNHTEDALGCEPRKGAPPFSRTPSGSVLPYRPFKADILSHTEENRDDKADLVKGDSKELDIFMEDSPDSCGPPTPLQIFDASGLGGTQPADHFAVRVETRRTKTGSNAPAKLSKFSLPGPGCMKFHHAISKSSLESFLHPELQSNEESITAHLASLAAFNSPSPQSSVPPEELPIKTEVVSAQFVRLQPSALPAPSGYYSMSEDDSEDFTTSSSSGLSRLRRKKSFIMQKSFASITDPDGIQARNEAAEKGQYSSEVEDNSDEEDGGSDDGSSIDMLAHVREIDPEMVAAREQEFEMAVDRKVSEDPVRSSVATVDEESGYSSLRSDERFGT